MIDIDRLNRERLEWESVARQGGEAAHRAASHALREVATAVRRIHENLRGLGYPDVAGVVAPPANVDRNIAEVRAVVGAIPDILDCFWREVGGIQLLDIPGYSHVDFWEKQGLSSNPGTSDGLWVYACDDDERSFVIGEAEAQEEDTDEEFYLLSFAPDHLHKDNISGGMPYSVEAVAGWLPPLRGFEWTGPQRPRSVAAGAPDLLSYLRASVFECAGFPGFYGAPRFEPIRERLLQGVELT